ncbi:MAG: hypothetical protein AB7U30_06190 [Sulfuricellaceae bacterium]|jgi:hypothetical protein
MSGENSTRVTILTGHYRIVGNIDLLPGARVTDYLAEAREFFAVTNAEVWDLDGRKISAGAFMNVNRNRIEVMMPES